MATSETVDDIVPPRATPPSTEVVEAVAKRKGIDSVDLVERLYDVIDPDALDTFLSSSNLRQKGTVSMKFTFCGYHITVYGDGRIVLHPDSNVADGDRGV